MRAIRSVVREHPFAAFVVVVFVLGVLSIPAAFAAPDVLPLLLSLSPAVAAVGLTALGEGRGGLRALFGRMTRWRVQPVWYLAAVGIPVVGTLLMVAGALVSGSTTAANVGTLSAALFVISFLFNGFEELGWRAYALPKVLRGYSPLAAGLLVGVFWAVIHLPLHLPGNWYAHLPVLPSVIILLAYSVLITWIFTNTKHSALLTTVFHAMLNTLTPLTAGIDLVQAWWLRAAVFSVLAVVVVIAAGRGMQRKPIRGPHPWPLA